MKIGELKSFGHNLADSLSSGMCMMSGSYGGVNIYAEAAGSAPGHVTVNFISGTTSGNPVSDGLSAVVQQFSRELPALCEGHGLKLAEIRQISARFGTDRVAGPHFSVTVESIDGRRSVDRYVGFPGRRYSLDPQP